MDAETFLDKEKSQKIEVIKVALNRLKIKHPLVKGFDSFAIAREIIVEGKEDSLPDNLHWQMKRVARSITSLLPTTKYEFWKSIGIRWSIDSRHPNHPIIYNI